jgi:hypothetical protein
MAGNNANINGTAGFEIYRYIQQEPFVGTHRCRRVQDYYRN